MPCSGSLELRDIRNELAAGPRTGVAWPKVDRTLMDQARLLGHRLPPSDDPQVYSGVTAGGDTEVQATGARERPPGLASLAVARAPLAESADGQRKGEQQLTCSPLLPVQPGDADDLRPLCHIGGDARLHCRWAALGRGGGSRQFLQPALQRSVLLRRL